MLMFSRPRRPYPSHPQGAPPLNPGGDYVPCTPGGAPPFGRGGAVSPLPLGVSGPWGLVGTCVTWALGGFAPAFWFGGQSSDSVALLP